MTERPYDEIGSRTRQAWLRTSLGAVAVALLVVRGMVLSDAGPGLVLLPLVPAGIFVGFAVVRMARLGPGASPGIGTTGLLGAVAGVLALAAVALGLIVAP